MSNKKKLDKRRIHIKPKSKSKVKNFFCSWYSGQGSGIFGRAVLSFTSHFHIDIAEKTIAQLNNLPNCIILNFSEITPEVAVTVTGEQRKGHS